MAVRNLVMAALPESRFAALHPQLVAFSVRQVIATAGAPLDAVLLPETCVIAHVNEMSDGRVVGTAFIGYHALVSPAIGGSPFSSDATFVCCLSGDAWRVSVSAWMELMTTWDRAYDVVGAGGRWCARQALQLSACARVHSLHRRTATVLLLLAEKGDRQRLELTHEFLGSLLGVQRPSISLIVERFAELSLIQTGRGGITILDRRGLETWACECYDEIMTPAPVVPTVAVRPAATQPRPL